MLIRTIKTIIIFFVGFFAGGIIITIIDCYEKIKPSLWDFNIIDILTLATYWIIGFYVTYYLVKRSSDRQMKKKLFLEIAKDIEEILETNFVFLQAFMKDDHNKEKERKKVIIILRKISRKITVLVKNNQNLNNKITPLVADIKECYFEIKEIITGDEAFTLQSFSDESVNKVIKKIDDINFKLDLVKLNIFD